MIRARGLLLGTLLLSAAATSAQMPSGGQMPSLWYNPALMMDPAVQKELKVSPEIAQKAVQTMMSEAMKIGPAMMGALNGKAPSPQQMKQASEALNKMTEASTKDLNPAQKARLHQITLQSYGPKALLDPKIGAQVGLTPAQHDKLQSALYAASKSAAASMKGAPGAPQPGGFDMQRMQQGASKSRAAGEAAMAHILTPKQLARWKYMQGKPIKLGGLAALMGG